MQKILQFSTRKEHNAIMFAISKAGNEMNLPRKLFWRYIHIMIFADPQWSVSLFFCMNKIYHWPTINVKNRKEEKSFSSIVQLFIVPYITLKLPPG